MMKQEYPDVQRDMARKEMRGSGEVSPDRYIPPEEADSWLRMRGVEPRYGR